MTQFLLAKPFGLANNYCITLKFCIYKLDEKS